MKKLMLFFILFAIPVFILSGCASYSASPLSVLSYEMIQTAHLSGEGNILITAKAFSKSDCKRHLDRDVIGKGYQPIQLYIQNNSDKNYTLSLNRINMTCARPEEVADKVHTSTVGRAAGYGAAAWFTFGILAIPAVVDGVKSSQANEALDSDFSSKTAREQNLIFPHSHFNKLIFVPVNEYQPMFTISLIDQESNQVKTFNVNVL